MELLADILLIAGALAAGIYCVVLSRRLRRFTDLEKGVGGAIAVLSAQVDDMTETLRSAQGAAVASAQSLGGLTDRAEGAARRLELLVAAMHDLPEAPPPAPAAEAASAPPSSDAARPTAESVPAQPEVASRPAPNPAPAAGEVLRAAVSGDATPQAEADLQVAPPEPEPFFLSRRRPVREAAE